MLSEAARERALRAAVPDTCYLGLAVGIEGGTVREVTDPAYRRQPVEIADVRHNGTGSSIANGKEVRFAPFMFDSPELHWWFLVSTPGGDGDVHATGRIDPQGYVDPDTGSLYSAREAKGRKDFGRLKAVPLRALAGVEVYFPAGAISFDLDWKQKGDA